MQELLPTIESSDAARELAAIKQRARRRKIAGYVVKYVVAAVLSVFFLFPYLFMVNRSLMSGTELAVGNMHFWPQNFQISNYAIVGQFWKNILNTLQVVLINGVFAPLTACICAFPLSRHKFFGKKFMFGFIMSTVLLPTAVLMIPQYFLYSQMGLIGKLSSQWIGAFWGGGALNIFLVIQFMRSIPRDMDNAARIDGANEYQIFFLIVFPLCFNVFLYMAISMVMGLWMDFQSPLLYLGNAQDQYTVGLAFYYYYTSSSNVAASQQNQLMAMCVCMSLVPMALFLLFQKQMIGGIKIGGIKA